MAVRRELVIDECGGASRRRRQAHVFNSTKSTKQKDKQLKARQQNTRRRTGRFALTRLQNRPVPPPPAVPLFPFASVFFFFVRLSVARFLAQVNGRKIVA